MSRDTLRLRFPRDIGAEAIEALLLRLHGLLIRPTPLWGGERAAIELQGAASGVVLQVWCQRPATARALMDTAALVLPGGSLRPEESPLPEPALTYLARISLGRADAPLRTDLPTPGLGAVLGVLGGLQRTDAGFVQFAVAPAPQAQAALLRQAARHERGGRRGSWADVLVSAQVNRHRARAVRDKAGSPLFHTALTAGGSSPQIVSDLAAAFRQFSGPYSPVRRRPVWWAARARRLVLRRALPAWPAPSRVNAGELASMLGASPELVRSVPGAVLRSRALPAPPAAAQDGRVICVSPARDGERPVAMRRADARLHSFLIGPTGTGKSTLIGQMALQAVRDGDGLVLLDPKGDLVEDLLRRLPDHRAGDVIVVDPIRDRDCPVGINLLARQTGQDAAAVTDAIVGVMRDLYARNWGARTDDTLYNGVFTAAALADTTLADLPRLYESAEFRRPFLAALKDPFVGEFWRWFDGLSPGERGTILAPVLNKLRPLLRPDLAPIIGQRRSTVDLDEVLARRRILLVRLPRDAALFGALLVARLWQAAQRRTAVPEERRPDVLVAIDEVQAFLRTGGDVGELLAMARGLRLSLCLATQHLEQCPPALRAALLANARTRVCFQLDASDAAALARGFAPDLEAADLTGLGRYEVAARMAINGSVSAPFTGRTLPLADPVRTTSDPLRAASRARYGTPREQVEAQLRDRLRDRRGDLDTADIGRKAAP